MPAGITHWQHPNFFAYFGAASSFPAMLGDMLCSGLTLVGFSWIGSPAATELEKVAPAVKYTFAACAWPPLAAQSSTRAISLFQAVRNSFSECRLSPWRRKVKGAMTLCDQVMLDWLGKLLMLPQQFLASGEDGKQQAGGGVIQVKLCLSVKGSRASHRGYAYQNPHGSEFIVQQEGAHVIMSNGSVQT